MKKNIIKILSIILLSVMIIGISNTVFAGSLVQNLQPNTSSSTVGKVSGVSSIIIGILQVIGVAAAIIMLVFLGIKYVSAAPSEKADIKKSAAIYVVGAVMLLGATVILGWIEGFINNDLATIADVKTIEQYIHLA